ncbi:hypothetical protein [Candidatus Poriferisocius sp.]|uniref:hypothetical protein n=1 Tax=Candidatus Poriferisocius sp. TaxID=3101276 RepID=UPI003B526C22
MFASAKIASVAVLACVIAVAAGIAVLQVRDHPQFSRVDEPQHFDYALKAPSAGVRIGEQYGLEATKVVACRGIDLPGWEAGAPVLPGCGDPQPDPTRSHSNGYNSAYLHPPVYYAATGLAGDAVLRLPGVHSSLVAYRLVGAVWLSAGLALVWYALGLANVGMGARAALVGLLGVSPMVVHASAFVNPDATALLGGGLVMLALLKYETGRWSWWAVPMASAVAVWLRLTNSAAVGVLVVYLGFRVWQKRDLVRERLLVAGVSSAAATSSVLGWRLWQDFRKLDDEEDLPLYASERFDRFRWDSLDDHLRAVITPFRDQWIPDVLPRSALVPLTGIADIGLLVLLGAAVAFTAAKSAHRALVGGVFAAMVGMGLLTMLANYWTLSRDAPIPGRYGLAILPFAAVAAAPVLSRNVLAKVLVGTLALATAGAMLYGVLLHGPERAVAVPPDSDTALGVWCSTTSTSYFWRWNEAEGASSYRVSLDGWSWEVHKGNTLTLTSQQPNTEAVLHVQAGNADGWDAGPSGSRACRTAPAGHPSISCVATSSSYTWTWTPVDSATRYRIRSDEAHPWFETPSLSHTNDGVKPNKEAVLYVQAGNAHGWNVEGVSEKTCRTKP